MLYEVITELNIEGYPSEDFVKLVIDVKADQATLVPDKPGQLTSDHGWNTIKEADFVITSYSIHYTKLYDEVT